MRYIYYPSCNFQRMFPETAGKIRNYLNTQADVVIAGCCHRTADLPENRDETFYDGAFLFREPFPQNVKEAPKYYRDYLPAYLTVLPQEQWSERIRTYAETIPEGHRIAGYCNTCVKSLKDAGVDALHLMEFAFRNTGSDQE